MKRILLSILSLLIISTMSMNATDVLFEKITDASTLNDGDKVLMVAETSLKAAAGKSSTGKYLQSVDVTKNADEQVVMEKSQVDASLLTLVKSSSYWQIKSGNYYVCTEESNTLSFQTTIKSRYTYTWNISIAEGIATIASTSSSLGTIYFNSNGFRNYASSTWESVALYKAVPGQEIHVESVTLSASVLTILEGKTATLTATVLPEDTDYPTVTWTSSDAGVATVDNGVVTAVGAGTATITATADGKSATCDVTVEAISYTTLKIVSDISQLTAGAKVAFSNASGANAMGAWNGTSNYPTTITSGVSFNSDRTTITVPSECIYTVEATAEGYAFKGYDNKYLYTYSEKRLQSRDTAFSWTASVASNTVDLTVEGQSSWGKVQYNSSSPCYNMYTSVQGALVMYSDQDAKPASPVAVTGVTLDKTELTGVIGGSATLTASVLPFNATNKNISWSSDAEAVATVAEGVVTFIAEGNATITVTTEVGAFTATCNVTVEEKPEVKGDYVIVTNASELLENDIVVFGNKAAQQAAGTISGTYLSAVAATIAEGVMDCSNALEFTLSKEDENWVFTCADGKLGSASKSIYIGSETSVNTWTISIADSVATVENTTTSNGWIQYNTGSPRFKTYTSSQADIELYKKKSTPTGVENAAIKKSECVKVIREGRVIIIRNGIEYDVMGREIR